LFNEVQACPHIIFEKQTISDFALNRGIYSRHWYIR